MRHVMIALVCLIAAAQASPPSGDEILRKVDDNFTADSKILVSKMVIQGRRGTRTVEAKSWTRGARESFTEYLAPARERGTKMLKLQDQLWTYSPQTDRIIKIAGHMLRQSVMGSDLSYEDMMEDPELYRMYNATVVGEDTLDGRPVWVIQLEAKRTDIAYQTRKIWVDQERYVILKEERFAKSGKLLKTTRVLDMQRQDGRWVPREILFQDQLQNGDGTRFVIESIEFDADIPDYVFSKASLRR